MNSYCIQKNRKPTAIIRDLDNCISHQIRKEVLIRDALTKQIATIEKIKVQQLEREKINMTRSVNVMPINNNSKDYFQQDVLNVQEKLIVQENKDEFQVKKLPNNRKLKDQIMSKGYAVTNKNMSKLPYRFRM